MSRAILDASALPALLFQEAGGEAVVEHWGDCGLNLEKILIR